MGLENCAGCGKRLPDNAGTHCRACVRRARSDRPQRFQGEPAIPAILKKGPTPKAKPDAAQLDAWKDDATGTG